MWWMLACGLQTAEEPDPTLAEASMDQASFLAGCWTTTASQGRAGQGDALATGVSECWKQRGRYLNGVFTDSGPDASPALQLMRMTDTSRGIELHTQAAGRSPRDAAQEPMVLTLADVAPGRLVFRRTGDGFPTEASYTLHDETLTVLYRGRVAGEATERAFDMRRDPVRDQLQRDFEAQGEGSAPRSPGEPPTAPPAELGPLPSRPPAGR